jgi:hypothetical protein
MRLTALLEAAQRFCSSGTWETGPRGTPVWVYDPRGDGEPDLQTKLLQELDAEHVGDAVEAAGYAHFNRVPHLCVDVPDGGFTITAKTSEGKRVTFSFMPYKIGGPPQTVDVVYHDAGTIWPGATAPTFEVAVLGKGPTLYASRAAGAQRPTLVAVLLEDQDRPTDQQGEDQH